MKTEKLSIFISIVLISILALGAVSAADDTAIADDASDAVLDEVQTIDNTITNDDISYESTDIIVNDTGDSADSKAKTTSLSANAVNEGETLSFTQLAADVSSSPSMLSGAYYKYDPSTDTAFENGITLTNGLTIIGGGATIDGDNQARIFNIPEGVSVTIMGVTLINGAAEEGAAIYNSGKLTLMNAKVNDNTAVKSGGGIYNNGGEVLVTSSEFDGNNLTDRTVNGYGGAAIYSNGGSVTITDTNVTNNLKNIVHRGGTGTYTGDLSSAAVTSNNADLTVTNSRFIANSGSYGGAIYSGESTSANLLVSGSTFEDNFAFNGGAIDIVGTSYTISDSTFKNNNVKGTGSTNSNYASGGAICVQDANNPGLISGCDFEANSGVVGGAVNCENTMVLDCTFTDNTANSANSETFNGKTNNRGGFAGAIYNEGTITISDCEFDDNAGRGEGIRVKNAEISDSSFTNTRIDTCQNSNVLLTNNTYNNPDRDVQAASGTQVTVDVADGDIPNANTAPYIVGDLTFTDLQALIDSGSSGIRLTGNVIKTAEEETTFADGLNVDKTVTIYGAEGKVIQANSGKIFNVAEGKTLTLRNATLQGSGETAITNYGTVYLYLADNNQFTDCGDVLIDNHGRTTETGLTTFTQLNNLIGLVNGGTVYIGESKITKAEDEKEAYKNGIVIDKDLSILGSYNTYYKYVKTSINANNDGRIFTVAEGKSLSLKYINVTNGTADEGAGVYVSEDATLIADTANFIKNTAVTKGGAIYSEGTVDLTNVNIKNNTISKTDGVMADDNGGAALYNNGGTATLDKVNVTDNQKTYVIGDIMDGVVVSKGATTITNSYFANNSGRWGGAITQTGTDQTLTVEDTIFEENTAIFGAAIFDNSPLVVKDCKFYNNSAIGPGSPGTSNSQGAAILVMDDTASADISGSEFINNTADCGGAVSLAGVGFDSSIDDCTFIDNTAYADGGAVYFWTESASVTVTDSEFISNTAPYGGAIENEGLGDLIVDGCEFTENTASLRGGAIISSGDTSVSNSKFTDNEASGNTNAIYLYNSGSSLSLSNNVITGSDDAQIYVKDGIDVVTPLKVKILNNETVNINMVPYDITATVTDDKGNNIVDLAFRFTVGDDVVDGISIDAATGVYTATFTPTQAGEFVVSTNLANADEVQTGTLNVFRTLTDLKAIIDANTNGTIDLDGNYAYNAEFDSALTDGIVINKDIVINGNGFTICGENSTRLFHVTSGFLTLKNATVCHGAAEKGAGVYVDHGSKLSTDYVTFTENTAVKRGGAIYSEGMVYIGNSVLDSNNITFRSANDDNGGAAVYNLNGQLTIEKSNITNNLKDIVIRNGNAGDLLVGVVVTTGDTLIKDSYFANNTGSWGGAISSLGYMNTDDYTLTVKGTTFEGNNATFGGAIFVESSNLVVDDCIFNENTGVGKGSDGTSNTQGGAIVVHPTGSKATITNSKFNKNSANTGGAVSLAGVGQDSLIEGCTFTDNTANDGGAVYLWTGGNAIVTVKDSSFSGNTANFGSAISSDGTLSLSHNEIANDYTITPIGSYDGTIVSAIYVTTLNGETIITGNPTQNLTATITDDNGNPIVEKGLVLEVYGEEVETSYDKTTGIHSAIHTFTKPNSYRITAKGFDQDHTTPGYIVYTGGTFNELQDLINAAEEGATITLDHSIVYDEEFDGMPFLDGITVNKTVTIVGAEGVEICANNLARVFKVTDGATLTLKDATVCHGTAQKGAGVYVDAGASLIADNVTFTKNTAVKRGGAIYSEGYVAVANSVIDSNDITFRTQNDDNGGAAIYNNKGTLIVEKTNITNNLKDIVIRNGNAGDLLVGVVVTSGETLITDSYFANNTGSWGGAISSLGYMNNEDYTLTVIGTTFEGNNATFGGAIFVESSNLVVDDCTFNNNKGLGVGSSGTSNTQGGAIVVFPNSAKATITNSRFSKNSANTGGAVSLAGVDQDSLIEGCTFTENTANDGGAIYLWTQDDAAVTVKGSTFTGNTANWGNAISTDGALKLDGNTISSTSADIGNWGGSIESKVYATILGNITYNWHMAGFVINATLTDDNGNLINDHLFNFVLSKEGSEDIILPATYYTDLGYYQATFTPTETGTYLINLDYPVEEVKTSVVTFSRSLIDLKALIDANTNGTLDLDGDYAYIAEFDESIKQGIEITKDITINGNGYSICGSDLARLFKVNSNTLTLKGLTICDGYCVDGGAIYVGSDAKLLANSVTFKDNIAAEDGGAIYSDGEITIADSTFNDNEGYNGGAICSAGTSTISNSKFIGNDPEKGGAIYVEAGETLIKENTEFTSNVADFGGAIYSEAGSTVTVNNVKFTHNSATNEGGAIYALGELTVKDSLFEDNSGEAGSFNIYHGGDITLENNEFKTLTPTIAVEEDVYYYDDTVPITGKLDWGVNNYAITLPVTWTRNGETQIPNKDQENYISNVEFTGSFDHVAAGKYVVNIATFTDANGNKYLIDPTATDTFTVEKFTPMIYVTVPDTQVSDNVIASIEVDYVNGNPIVGLNLTAIVYEDGATLREVPVTTDAEGKAAADFGKLNLRNYTAFVLYKANDNYADQLNVAYGMADFRVLDIPKLTVLINNAVYGDAALVEVTLESEDGVKLDGVVEISIQGLLGTITVPVANGKGTTEIYNLDVGTYTYTASSRETGNYLNTTFGPETFRVNPKVVVIDFPIPPIEFGEDGFGWLNVFVYDPQSEDQYENEQVSTTAVLIIMDKDDNVLYRLEDVQISAEDSVVDLKASDLTIGDYKVTVVLGDNFYIRDGKDTFDFKVTPIVLDAEIAGPKEITYGEEDTHEITLGKYNYDGDEPVFVPYDYDGTATVTVWDDDVKVAEIPVTFVDGKGTISFEDVAPGLYFFEIALDSETYVLATDEDDNPLVYELAINRGDLKVDIIDEEDLSKFVFGDKVVIDLSITDATSHGVPDVTIAIDGYDITVDQAGGLYEVSLGTLEPGTYTLTATFSKEGYDDVTKDITLVVSKADITLDASIINQSIKYGQKESITVGTNNTAFSGTIKVSIINYYNGTLVKTIDVVIDPEDESAVLGYVLAYIEGLEANTYNITASFAGNEHYNAADAVIAEPFRSFEVKKAATEVMIEIPDVKAGDDIPVSILLSDEFGNYINGTVNVEVAGVHFVKDVEDGELSFTIPYDALPETFAPGIHEDAFVTVRSSHNYEASDASDKYEVFALDDTINIADPGEVSYGAETEATFNITDEEGNLIDFTDAEVSVTVDDAAATVVVKDGVGTYTIPASLATGTHTVTVVYNGGNKYKEGTKELEFTVVKATPILEVTADDDLMPRQDATIEITLTGALGEAIKGIVLVTVDGKDYVLNTNDEGKAELTISDLTADKYPIFAKFIGNDKYNEVVNDTEAIDFMMHAATFDIVIEDITYGDALLVIVDNVTDGDGNPLTGTVLGNIENATGQGAGLVVNIENGRGTRTITGLDAGNYSVSATFADEDYEFVSDTKEFTINVAKAESDLSIVYEDGTFTFTLNGVNGEKLNETLSVAIDAVPIDAAITTDNGTATYDSTFDAGTYVVSAVFEGNDNYLGSFYVLQFTVPKQTPTVTVVSEPVEWGNPATVKVTVTDADGNAINGTAVVRVSWDVDGVDEFIDIVDGAGEASFEISRLVAPGEYDVKVMFEGGRNYNDVNSTAKLTLTAPKDITVDVDVEAGDYGEVTNVTVTVTDKANAPVANAPVTVIVDNGEPKSATTDENGVVTVPLKDLAAGEHNITVKVDDGVHTPAEEEVKVTVGPASGANIQFTATDVEYGNAYPIKITVVDSDDEPLDGKAIIVLDGNAIAEVDIVDGAGEYNITGLEVGNYYLEVIFNNDNYLPSSYSDKINVTRATPTVKVEDAEAEWGSPATIKVTVYDSEGMPIEGAAVVRVSWIVDGVDQYIDITEGSGEASFEISKLVAPGEYDVKVMFEGGRNYNDVNATAKLTLAAPKDLIVDVEVEAGNYGEDTNVTVTVTDKANTPVANAPVSVIVDNGEAIPATTGEDGTVTVPLSDLIAGDHNITVKVNDGVHTPAEEEVKVTVGPASGANIQFTATDVEYGNAYPIKITVTDAEDLELDGKAIIVLDGNQIAEVDIVDGAGEYNITGLDVGSYYLEVIFDNDNYLPSSYSDKINVTRATPTVKVEDAEAEWGIPATIKVTVYDSEGMPIEGTAVVRVSWIVDGVDQYIDITEGSGEASFEISRLVAPGEYDVKVMFEGGRNYNDVNATAKLTLTAPKDLIVDVNVEAGNYGEDTNVTVTVTDKANTPVADAPVTVVVDGKEYKNVTTDENGTVTLPVSDLIAGDHNITVKVDDGEHTPTEETASATVEPASGADIQATVQPGHAGEDTIVNISAKDSEDEPLEGNAIVLVDGEPYTEVSLDENGTASVAIKDLPTGEHTVEVVFNNTNYLPSSYTTHFDVKAQDTKLVVTVDKENIVYGDGAVTATLNLSADGKPINGVVEVVLNGEVQNVTVTDGKATVKFDDLAAGNYTVVADYLGTSVYTGASDSSNFNVERKATKFNYKNMNTTAVNPNIDGRIGEYFKFQLVDEDGKALANKDVVIGFNGKTYNRTTNATGWAELQINLAIIFRYTFAINFAGDENYTSAFNVALINVTAQAPKLTTSSKTYAASAKTKSLTATFKTKSGNAVSGRKITFTVNGKSYSAKTNSKGVATVKVSISKKGTYSFTAKFAGDDTYAAASKSAKLTIK